MFALTFDVSGAPSLTDAFATFAGTTTGTGTEDLSEVLIKQRGFPNSARPRRNLYYVQRHSVFERYQGSE
jgi:hypothetical protein